MLDLNLRNTFKELPSTAWQALKDYFAGLKLFFNRKNWSHSMVFIVTLSIFLILALSQALLPIIFFDPIFGIIPAIRNVVFIAFLGGCGAFVGFLFLGLIAFFSVGRKSLYESRFRHTISPLIIVTFSLLFISVVPTSLRFFPNLSRYIFGQDGLFELVFRGCWVVLVFFQVILLGYTIIKTIKWISGYLNISELRTPTRKNLVILVLLLLLTPIAIVGWFFVIIGLMIPPHSPPDIPIYLPSYVRWLLSQSPWEYAQYLLIVFPIVAISAAVMLLRNRPRVAVAIACFGNLYPVLVYYYRLRVIQYFLFWDNILTGVAAAPFKGYGFFEMILLLVTFALVLLGAAKLQRNISPNPFGLFGMMIGSLVFAISWVVEAYNPMIGIEYYGMITSALSAFLALVVFIVLPIAYGIYQMKRLALKEERDMPIDQQSEIFEANFGD